MNYLILKPLNLSSTFLLSNYFLSPAQSKCNYCLCSPKINKTSWARTWIHEKLPWSSHPLLQFSLMIFQAIIHMCFFIPNENQLDGSNLWLMRRTLLWLILLTSWTFFVVYLMDRKRSLNESHLLSLRAGMYTGTCND